jgi:hypothetical protein
MATKQVRARAYRTQTVRQELEERIVQLKALSRSQTTISTNTPFVEDVLHGVLYEQIDVLQSDTAIIVLREENTSMFRIAGVSGYGKRESTMLRVRVSLEENPILSEMNRTHTGLIVDDVRTDARVRNLGGSTDVERSLLIAPLVCQGMFLGVTAVSRIFPGAYTSDKLELLTLFANQAAVAIMNARLHQTLQQQRNELARHHRTHEVLMTLVLCGGTLRDIANVLAEQCGMMVEIQATDGGCLARAAFHGSDSNLRGARLCVPVVVQQHHLADIYLYGNYQTLNGSLQVLAEQASLVVALKMMREQVTDVVEQCQQSDSGIVGILERIAGQQDLAQFTLQALGPVLTHKELLATLRFYLASNGSLAYTAQHLFMHRNTVLYRLKQIEKLLNVSLNSSETRLHLSLALKILEIPGLTSLSSDRETQQ